MRTDQPIASAGAVALPRLMKAKEIANHLGIDVKRVYDLVDKGMPCTRFGRALRFDVRKVAAWIDAGGTAADR